MRKHIKARYRRIDQLEALYTKKIRLALLRENEKLIAMVEAGATVDLVAAMVSEKTIQVVLEELYLRVIQQEAKYEYLHLLGEQKATPALPVTDWLRRARNYIVTEGSKAITAITNTTRNNVRKVLKESLSAGDSIPATAKNLRTKVTQFTKTRATTIVRTELISSLNAAASIGALSTGLKLDKLWLSTSDGRTRSSHSIANGQRVDIQERFSVGGETADYPADPGLSAKERVRCRCTILHVPKPRLIQGTLNF